MFYFLWMYRNIIVLYTELEYVKSVKLHAKFLFSLFSLIKTLFESGTQKTIFSIFCRPLLFAFTQYVNHFINDDVFLWQKVFRYLVEAWTFHAKASSPFSHIAKFLVMKNSKYCFRCVPGSPCRDPHLIPPCRNFTYLVGLLFDLQIFWILRHLSLNMYKSLSSQISWNLKKQLYTTIPCITDSVLKVINRTS